MRLLVTFHSVSQALLLETEAKERGFFCALIPVPRKLSSSCGYAAEVEADAFPVDEHPDLLRKLNIEWEAVYKPVGDGYQALHRSEG